MTGNKPEIVVEVTSLDPDYIQALAESTVKLTDDLEAMIERNAPVQDVMWRFWRWWSAFPKEDAPKYLADIAWQLIFRYSDQKQLDK